MDRFYIQEVTTKKYLSHLFEDRWQDMFLATTCNEHECYSYGYSKVAKTIASTLEIAHNIKCKVIKVGVDV
jgi:hypothetical protein